MPGPRNLAGSQLIAGPLGCTGVANPRGEAAEEGQHEDELLSHTTMRGGWMEQY